MSTCGLRTPDGIMLKLAFERAKECSDALFARFRLLRQRQLAGAGAERAFRMQALFVDPDHAAWQNADTDALAEFIQRRAHAKWRFQPNLAARSSNAISHG